MANSAAALQYQVMNYSLTRLHLKTTCLIWSNICVYVDNSDLCGCQGEWTQLSILSSEITLTIHIDVCIKSLKLEYIVMSVQNLTTSALTVSASLSGSICHTATRNFWNLGFLEISYSSVILSLLLTFYWISVLLTCIDLTALTLQNTVLMPLGWY